MEQRFEVYNSAIAKDVAWIPDIAHIFDPDTSLVDLVNGYCEKNQGTSHQEVFRSLELLRGITSNQIGLIELASDLDIDTVTEIFIRVNSERVPLSQADFAMSKIAVNESYGGNTLRKAIDYFCHMAVSPEFYSLVEKNDPQFAGTEYFKTMAWLRKDTEDLYKPSYTDLLRVAFTSEFRRGRLEDLVALLWAAEFSSGAFPTKASEDCRSDPPGGSSVRPVPQRACR